MYIRVLIYLCVRVFREVWPENDIFGSSTMEPDEEFAVMRTIFLADIGGENIGEFVQKLIDDIMISTYKTNL